MAKSFKSLWRFLFYRRKTSQKHIVVIVVVYLIFLLYILNGRTSDHQYLKREYLDVLKSSSSRQKIPFDTCGHRTFTEKTKSEGKDKPMMDFKRNSITNLSARPINLSSNSSYYLENDYICQVTDCDITKITLKPNFSELINASEKISTINASYLLENKNICSSVKNMSTLIIVHTACDHFTRRQLSRRTWANPSLNASVGVFRILFLLGKPKDEKVQKIIREESEKYKDILQGNFIDTYYNLTLKGVMAYKWLSDRCTNAKFILKIDDDIVVNMFKLFVDILPKYAALRRQIVCNYIKKDSMPIFRKNNSKWLVNQRHFRNLKVYPTSYCSGFMVLFTNDLTSAFYRSSVVTPFFWVEDVYLYGLVPNNVPGVKYSNFPGQWFTLDGQKALMRFRNTTKRCDYLALGIRGEGEIEEIWKYIVKR